MSSTTKDIQLGADLVIKAIGEDVKGYLTRTEDPASKDFREKATESLRALSIWQIDNKILTMDENTRYQIDEEKLNGLSDAKVQEGGALYKTVVDNHMPLISDMYMQGKTQYVEYFSDVHRPVQIDLLQPESRVTEASLDAVAQSSLSLIEAAYRDPNAASNLAGVNQGDIAQLEETLSDAGYLVGGENPDRKAPLSEQSPRGDFDQKMAIFTAASTFSSNIELPDTITGLDTVALSAHQLRKSINEAETEEYMSGQEVGINDLTAANSDLQKEDIGSLYMTLLVGAMATRKAQFSTDMADFDEENPMVVIPGSYNTKTADGKIEEQRDIIETLGIHVKHLEETGVTDVISRGATPRTSADFMVPGLAPTDNQLPHVASTLKRFLNAAKGLAEYVHDEDERIDGDAGGKALGGPHGGMEASEEGEDQFDQEIDLEADGEDYVASSADSPAMDHLDPVERKVPEKLVENMAKALDELESVGVLRRMSDMIGRDDKHNDQEIFSEGRGSVFGSLEDFMQADESTQDASNKDYKTDTYGLSQIARMSPDRAENLTKQGAVVVSPKRGFLAKTNYMSGSASVAPRRVKDFVNTNLTDENGKPNIGLRTALRKMAERPVIAGTETEAKAWKEAGQQFVERENEEHKLRLMAAEEKAGLWTMDVSRRDLSRALVVAQASGNNDPFKLVINEKGAFLSRDDAPKITLDANEGIPEDITKAKVSRQMGGMLKMDAIQGALENMEARETKAKVAMTGERPRGVTSQVITDRERQKEAAKSNKPKGLESHLPDVLS